MMGKTLQDVLEVSSPEGLEQECSFYFEGKPLPAHFSYALKEKEELVLTLVDFSPSSYHSDLSFTLKANSRIVLKMFSLCPRSVEKKITVSIHHLGKDSFSRVSFFGIDFSEKKFSFVGNSYIPKGMSGSDTRQEGRITNLAKDCKSEVSPALYIEENDVKASHGAALGTYDQDQVYYLMSHGLDETESKRLITSGLLRPILERLKSKEIAQRAQKALEVFSL